MRLVFPMFLAEPFSLSWEASMKLSRSEIYSWRQRFAYSSWLDFYPTGFSGSWRDNNP